MNFPFFLFFICLCFGFVSCEKCSEDLHETFKKEFPVAGTCQNCEVLNPGTTFRGENWAGFCAGGQLFLFRNWTCKTGDELLFPTESFAVVNDDLCHQIQWKRDFDKACLQKFNRERCTETEMTTERTVTMNITNVTELESIREKTYVKSILVSNKQATKVSTEPSTTFTTGDLTSMPLLLQSRRSSPSPPPPTTTTTTTATTPSTTTRTTTTTTPSPPTTTTTTPSSTPETPPSTTTTTTTTITPSSTPETPPSTTTTTTTTITPSSTPETPPSTTTTTAAVSLTPATSPPIQQNCEKGEYYFNDHCYIAIEVYRFINVTEYCQNYHPNAYGLAVETEEENYFCSEAFSRHSNVFLTSGIKVNDKQDEWMNWNVKINQSIVNGVLGNPMSGLPLFYCFLSGSWFLFDNATLENFGSEPGLYVICERPYNPKNIQLQLHENCLELYRNHSRDTPNFHQKYCCEMDDKGEMWFTLARSQVIRLYPYAVYCEWHCDFRGFFINDRPTCWGNISCFDFYNSVLYKAPLTRYAISDCPKGLIGNSTWFCSQNKTFVGKPDYSSCCKRGEVQCRDIDTFLNPWSGCPLTTVVKKTACPPGSYLSTAEVEWYCQENGKFRGSSPDYSNCNVSEIACNSTDSYNRTWIASIDTTAQKECPPNFTGKCFWECKKNGKFDGPEPDCSACEAKWMSEIADKIKNQSSHEDVMVVMETYTKNEDIRIGYGKVLKLTAACVDLFKNQTSQCEFGVFDKFLKSYSRILKNVAGNSSIWSSFSEANRRNFTDSILSTTQTAAFANLEFGNGTLTKYNKTLAKFEEDGFDFFVAYNPSAGAQFPLENVTNSDWHLDITEIRETKLKFAAMGLVMNYSLTSLMFPKGNETEHLEINSPAITFTVAGHKNGAVVIDPNVVVSVSFKHTNKTRMPDSEVIRRRLHPGEQPSGVFNSTLCFYYRNSDWSTDGCSVSYTSKEQTNCTCNHLSTIGLLMSVHKYQPNVTLEVLSSVSSTITILALVLALLVFYSFDSINNDRVLIGINLCICLLIGHCLLITVIDKKFFNLSDNLCSFWAVLLHYTFMAAFAWMFVEGCHLYRMLIVIFDSNIEYRRIYLLIGYGMPLVIVGVTYIFGFILQEQPYGQDEMCWLKAPNFVWAFVGPVIVLTSINFCILVVAMKIAISSKNRTGKSSFTSFTLWKGWMSLSALLGITWLFGLAYIHYNEPLVYVFVLLNGLQGLFIFIFRCILNEQYKTAVLKKVKSWIPMSKSMDLKKTQNVKSETKVWLISASKSLSETKDSGFDPGPIESGIQNNKKKVEKPKTKISESSSGVDEDLTLTPAVSEAYLRNKMIARNFSRRTSKAKWLYGDSFPELSYHDLHPN